MIIKKTEALELLAWFKTQYTAPEQMIVLDKMMQDMSLADLPDYSLYELLRIVIRDMGAAMLRHVVINS